MLEGALAPRDGQQRPAGQRPAAGAGARARARVGVGYADYGRATAEVLVDTVSYIVCPSTGLAVSGSSVPYLAGWGEDGDLEAIKGYAEVIDRTAGRLEAALG